MSDYSDNALQKAYVAYLASFGEFELSFAPLEIHAITAVANVPLCPTFNDFYVVIPGIAYLDTSKGDRHRRDGAQKERNNDSNSRELHNEWSCAVGSGRKGEKKKLAGVSGYALTATSAVLRGALIIN